MAGVPLLTTDYFSAPQAPGISDTVARIMAENGRALAAQIDRFATVAEAHAKAPALSEIYKGGFAKIAAGDMSGFGDMAGGIAIAAGNPLLSGMVKESNDIAAALANHVTQSRLQDERIRATEEASRLRFQDQSDLQEDRQREQERQKVITENIERDKSNREAVSAAEEESRITGKRVEPEGLKELLPVPESIAPAPRATPTGRPPVRPFSNNPTRATGREPGMGVPVSISPSGLAIPDELPTKGVSTTDGDYYAPGTYPMKTSPGPADVQDPNQFPNTSATPPRATAVTVSQTPTNPVVKSEPEADIIQFGQAQIKVGKAKGTEDFVLDRQTIKTATGSKTFARQDEDKTTTGKTDPRTDFLTNIGTMNAVDPEAADFASSFLAPNGKGVKFENVIRDGGKVIRATMIGLEKDGKEVPYKGTGGTAGDPTAPASGEVDGEFYNAWVKAMSVKDSVKSKHGIEMILPEKPVAKSLGDKDVDAVSAKYAPMIEAAKTTEEKEKLKAEARAAARKVLEKKDELKLADDKYKLPSESEIKKEAASSDAPQVKAKVASYKKEVERLEEMLDKGMPEELSGEDPVSRWRQLSTAERRKYILMRSNLLKKIRELEG